MNLSFVTFILDPLERQMLHSRVNFDTKISGRYLSNSDILWVRRWNNADREQCASVHLHVGVEIHASCQSEPSNHKGNQILLSMTGQTRRERETSRQIAPQWDPCSPKVGNPGLRAPRRQDSCALLNWAAAIRDIEHQTPRCGPRVKPGPRGPRSPPPPWSLFTAGQPWRPAQATQRSLRNHKLHPYPPTLHNHL